MIALSRSAASQARELNRHRAKAVREVDSAVGRTRLKYITDLPGQENTYRVKEEEARAYLSADPEPADASAFPFIEGEVGITAPTAYEVAQVIANLAAQWRVLAQQLEGIRQSTKAAIEAAPDRAAVESAAETAITTLEMY